MTLHLLENAKSASTKCFLDLTLDIWSKKNSPTRKPCNSIEYDMK